MNESKQAGMHNDYAVVGHRLLDVNHISRITYRSITPQTAGC